jgi:hypothetical protein
MTAVEEAWPHYARAISTYFAGSLSRREILTLATVLAKVRDQFD